MESQDVNRQGAKDAMATWRLGGSFQEVDAAY
jgi:hypothetical protein